MSHEHRSAELGEKEWKRLQVLNRYEEEARLKGFQWIAGIDEAGRGPLAGPVVAAACMIPAGIFIPQVNDSKKLTPQVRQQVFKRITSDAHILYGIGIIEADEIDRINIYQATIQAMLMAISQLPISPDYLLVDGMHFPPQAFPCLKIIKGDTLSQSIAAASILAKETRDHLMCRYHEQWPHYGFNQHKGYGTPQHLEALNQYGPCAIHRRSFKPCQKEICSNK